MAVAMAAACARTWLFRESRRRRERARSLHCYEMCGDVCGDVRGDVRAHVERVY